MSARTVLVFCTVAIVARSAFCACAPGLATSSGLAGSGYSNCGAGLNSCGCSSAGVASTGGSLPVASASPVAPVGVSLLSENAYEGELCTSGNLPFLGTVGIEGVLPTAGAGSVSYGCGNGAVGIASEGPINTGIIGSALRKSAQGACAGTGYGLAGSYGANLGSCGCGGIRSPSGFVGYGAGLGSYGCGGVASTGGGLSVVSASPIAPAGISVLSDNAYEGSLSAGGNLPFLSAVGIEGALPTVGAGAVSYGCGNGAVGITSEGPIGTGILAAGSFPPSGIAGNAGYGIAGYGLGVIGYGLGGLGCGCSC